MSGFKGLGFRVRGNRVFMDSCMALYGFVRMSHGPTIRVFYGSSQT